MINISVEKINHRSPIKVSYIPSNGTFNFITKEGITYTIGLIQETILHHPGIYQMFIQSDKHGHKDGDLVKTIISILEVFFETGGTAISYVCDIRDGRQGARNRLFKNWFNSYSHRQLYAHYNKRIQIDQIEYYSAIIIKKDEPRSDSVIAEYENLMNELDPRHK